MVNHLAEQGHLSGELIQEQGPHTGLTPRLSLELVFANVIPVFSPYRKTIVTII